MTVAEFKMIIRFFLRNVNEGGHNDMDSTNDYSKALLLSHRRASTDLIGMGFEPWSGIEIGS